MKFFQTKLWLSKARRRALGRFTAAAMLAGVGLFLAAPAQADSCREWRVEHHEWKSEAVRRYLDGSPGKDLDNAVFEMLQREAYLTSCNMPVRRARQAFVGWRLVGRGADEYGRAVVESLLEEAGMDLTVRNWFGPMLGAAGPTASLADPAYGDPTGSTRR